MLERANRLENRNIRLKIINACLSRIKRDPIRLRFRFVVALSRRFNRTVTRIL